jgi:hypothetical protein
VQILRERPRRRIPPQEHAFATMVSDGSGLATDEYERLQ